MSENIVDKCVLAKVFTCKVCGNDFYEYVVRTTKIRFMQSDVDMRPHYTPLDPLPYDVYMCPYCGYAAIGMFFNKISERQEELIKEKITPKFRYREYPKVRNYNHALERLGLALVSAIIKEAKSGELGFICLKMAWCYRLLDQNEKYNEYLQKALIKFELAYSEEDFPICKMDETTFEYVIAYLYYALGNYEESLKWNSKVILDRNVVQRLKEKALDLKYMIKYKQDEEKEIGGAT